MTTVTTASTTSSTAAVTTTEQIHRIVIKAPYKACDEFHRHLAQQDVR